MTPERAKFILNNPKIGGDFRFAFRRKCDSATSILHADGIAVDEDKFIRDVWATMPGHTCYHDALVRIARGEFVGHKPTLFRCVDCKELRPPRAQSSSDSTVCAPCMDARITGRPMKSLASDGL